MPYWLKLLFDEFGSRMYDREAWRGRVLLQRGCLSVEELRKAVVDGYFVPLDVNERPFSTDSYLRAGLLFAAESCFYRLTPLGCLTGLALGASSEDSHAAVAGTGRHARFKIACLRA